jgi:A/G-specific adenine glycosylase
MEQNQYPGDINQALIELGSTVCKVRDPNCEACPLRHWCRAFTVTQSPSVGPVSDIEDLCTLCEPVEEPSDVTLYPMKADRKKAREELDIVSIIEWQSSTDSDDRWFLMVRRPEGGMFS